MKVLSIKFHGNPSSGKPADTCGQTDGHDEANKRFSRLCERALKGSQVVDLILKFFTALTKSEIYTWEANYILEHQILRYSDMTANADILPIWWLVNDTVPTIVAVQIYHWIKTECRNGKVTVGIHCDLFEVLRRRFIQRLFYNAVSNCTGYAQATYKKINRLAKRDPVKHKGSVTEGS